MPIPTLTPDTKNIPIGKSNKGFPVIAETGGFDPHSGKGRGIIIRDWRGNEFKPMYEYDRDQRTLNSEHIIFPVFAGDNRDGKYVGGITIVQALYDQNGYESVLFFEVKRIRQHHKTQQHNVEVKLIGNYENGEAILGVRRTLLEAPNDYILSAYDAALAKSHDQEMKIQSARNGWGFHYQRNR